MRYSVLAEKFLLLVFSAIPYQLSAQTPKALVMNYDAPATVFEEAIPLGNGHIGAMVYGRVYDEIIRLNEATLWGGADVDNNPVPDGPEKLADVREALLRDDWQKGQELLMQLQGRYVSSFLSMGSLRLSQTFGNEENRILRTTYNGSVHDDLNFSDRPEYNNYRRSLDLGEAVARTCFDVDGVTYKREIFVSHPDKVLVIHLTSSEKGRLEFTLDARSAWDGATVEALSSDEFAVSG